MPLCSAGRSGCAHNAAAEGVRQRPLEKVFGGIVQDAVNGDHIDLPGYGRARIVLDGASLDTVDD